MLLCFFAEVVDALGRRPGARPAATLHSELGRVVVDSAVREGTSFHYLPASRMVEADPAEVAALSDLLHRAGIAHTVGRTWSTDALYRETPRRIRRRRDEGCLTVEMEAAALLAVARFRDVALVEVLFAGDSLAGGRWEDRGWATAHDARSVLAQAALDACRQRP